MIVTPIVPAMATTSKEESEETLDVPTSWLPVFATLEARVRAFVDGHAEEAPALAPEDVPPSLRELEDSLALDDVDLAILIIAAAAAIRVEIGALLKELGQEPDASGPTVMHITVDSR